MFIPIRTDRPRLRPAYLTITLIVICTLVQVYSRVLGDASLTVAVDGAQVTAHEPALVLQLGLWGDHPTLLTLFTHMFIHGDELHLIGNMLYLWLFGSLIEDALRPWGLAALFVGGGFCAAAAHIGISVALGHNVHVPMVGASGAIAAIMGLFMLRFHKTQVQVAYVFQYRWGTMWVKAVWAMLIWVGIEILQAVFEASFLHGAGGVAHWAHIGGFVAGIVAAPFVGGLEEAQREYRTDDPETNVEYLRRSEQVAAAEKALRADPGNAYLLRAVAQAHAYAGDYAEASHAYQECVCRFAHRNMLAQAEEVYLEVMQYNTGLVLPADVLLKLGRQLEAQHLVAAITAYRTITLNHPTRGEAEFALLRLAVLHRDRLEQPYEAIRLLNDFVRRYPNSEWAPQARHSLAELDARYRMGR